MHARMYVGKSKLFDGCAGWTPSMKVVTASINRIYKLNLRLTGSNPQSCANRIAEMMASSPVRCLSYNLRFESCWRCLSYCCFPVSLFLKENVSSDSVKVQCSFFNLLFQANPLPHGLDKIADVQGYLVLNSDGAVLAVSTLVQSMVDIVYVLLGKLKLNVTILGLICKV